MLPRAERPRWLWGVTEEVSYDMFLEEERGDAEVNFI